jgi:hypothetical protein
LVARSEEGALRTGWWVTGSVVAAVTPLPAVPRTDVRRQVAVVASRGRLAQAVVPAVLSVEGVYPRELPDRIWRLGYIWGYTPVAS